VFTFLTFIYSPKHERLFVLARSAERTLLSSMLTTLRPTILNLSFLPKLVFPQRDYHLHHVYEPSLISSSVSGYGHIPQKPTQSIYICNHFSLAMRQGLFGWPAYDISQRQAVRGSNAASSSVTSGHPYSPSMMCYSLCRGFAYPFDDYTIYSALYYASRPSYL
jgi:hypothetical protein